MLGPDLIALFTEQGLGQYGTTTFLGSKALPKDGTVLVVIGTGGLKPGRVHNRMAPAIRRPGAQITARAMTRTDAEALAEQAYQAVHTVVNRELNGTVYLSIGAQQEPSDMGTDDQGRIKFGFNVLAEVAG